MSSGKEDTRSNNSSNVAASILDLFSKQAKELLQPLRQFLTLSTIIGDVEEAGRNIAVDVDPQVAMVVEDLKVVLHEVGCKVELYVSACRDMAEYVTDDGLMDEVKGDLDAGSVEELKDFVEDMSAFTEACVKCLDDFNKSEAKFRTEVDGRAKQWSTKANKGAKRERISKTVAVTSGLGAFAVGAVGVALIGTGIGAPVGIAAIASLSIVGGSCVVAGAAGGGLAAAFAIDAGLTQKQKEVFVDASKRVVKFYMVLTEVRETAQSMEKNMQAVTHHINGAEGQTSRGLRDHAENPEMKTRKQGKTTLRYARVIKISLNGLYRAMEEVLSDAQRYLTKTKEKIRDA